MATKGLEFKRLRDLLEYVQEHPGKLSEAEIEKYRTELIFGKPKPQSSEQKPSKKTPVVETKE